MVRIEEHLLNTLREVLKKRDNQLFLKWKSRLIEERSFLIDKATHEVLPPLEAHLVLERIGEINRTLSSSFIYFNYEIFKVVQRVKARRGEDTLLIIKDDMSRWSEYYLNSTLIKESLKRPRLWGYFNSR